VLASLAASRTDSLLASGDGQLAALTGGCTLPSSSVGVSVVADEELGAPLLHRKPLMYGSAAHVTPLV
jgi:hypothetical protein